MNYSEYSVLFLEIKDNFLTLGDLLYLVDT